MSLDEFKEAGALIETRLHPHSPQLACVLT